MAGILVRYAPRDALVRARCVVVDGELAQDSAQVRFVRSLSPFYA
jgi:hypothetical protein